MRRNPLSYKYLSASQCASADSADDSALFARTVVSRNDGSRRGNSLLQSSMHALAFDDRELWFIWRVIAAILHLGNVTFVSAGESCTVGNPEGRRASGPAASSTPSNEQPSLSLRSYSSSTLSCSARLCCVGPRPRGAASETAHSCHWTSRRCDAMMPCVVVVVFPEAPPPVRPPQQGTRWPRICIRELSTG